MEPQTQIRVQSGQSIDGGSSGNDKGNGDGGELAAGRNKGKGENEKREAATGLRSLLHGLLSGC